MAILDGDLERILDMEAPSQEEEINETLPEDLGIIQPDGYRSCIHWEIRGKGYHLDDSNQSYELSDEELLASAYKELKKRNSFR